ncbi:hypothetical protein [Spiroplasma endosymbiont of Asaphidion curtum]|uniref:hypothetical protein n=1 Tax=Spiroplasma endosymbiont of Asaphidion curtum TaxID=3066281 RepID=UPI00313B21A4
MNKIISWFIIMFIGLVPLGAFFDTKQPPKPNMEQFFMKREKRATNPSQCGNSCNFEFSEILNSSFTPSTYNLKDGWLDVAFVKNQLPNDLGPVGNYIYWSIVKTVRDFYEKNFTSIEHNRLLALLIY